MHAQASERVGHSVVIGHYCAPVAITTERLCGEETGRRRLAKSTQSTVAVSAPKALSCIIQNQQAFGFRGDSDSAVVGRRNRTDQQG